MLTYQVDDRSTIGANERAAAAATAGAIAAALGLPPADHQARARLHEAVRQVRAATIEQRPGRLGVLHALASAAPDRIVPAALAAELATLVAAPNPADRHARWTRVRALAGATGWLPEDEECTCEDGEPCTCGAQIRKELREMVEQGIIEALQKG
ncbi:hypothetical protein ACFQYP_21615 [Nonomuraea antimicrobica]